MTRKEFDDRMVDIDALFKVISFIDGVETYKNAEVSYIGKQSLRVDSYMQKCMRAQAIIMLYNLVESTIRNCIFMVYDAITDKHLKYEELSNELKVLWIEQQLGKKTEHKTIRKNMKVMVDCINFKEIRFVEVPSDIGGNLDIRKVIKISKKIGIELEPIPQKDCCAKSLLFVKTHRNNLAHGNVTFSNTGSLLTLRELEDHKRNICSFLGHTIVQYKQFIDRKAYYVERGDCH